MAKWICTVCSYRYMESRGSLHQGIIPGTLFKDLPLEWICPICGTQKEAFILDKEDSHLGEIKTNVADVIISELKRWGINLIFGMPGTSSLGLVEAVRKDPDMRYIVVRHEGNGAMAASAFNKLTGRMAACLTIAGPGATNLATGLYDAKQDRASVISLNGQVDFQYIGPGGGQEIDQDAFFKPICVFNNTLHDKYSTVKVLSKALKYAKLERGVSQISVPNNIQKEPLDVGTQSGEQCLQDYRIIPPSDRIAEAASLIDKADKPVILVGWGAYGHGIYVTEMAEKIKAPIVTTWRAKGIVPDNHEWLIGVHGGVGPPQAVQTVRESDLLISFGAGFSEKTAIPEDIPTIQVDIDPLRLGRHPYQVALWGDCGEVIPLLVESVTERSGNKRRLEMQKIKKSWQTTLDEEGSFTGEPLWPPFIMKILSESLPRDAVISIDVGDNGWWFGRNFQMSEQRFVMSGYLGTMGFGFPGALAAKLAFPDKMAFCITGDGGFQMAMSDFVTAVEHKLQIVVILMNNGQLAMIRQEQNAEGFPNYATGLRNPDYASFAKDCGGLGLKVIHADELAPAIEVAMKYPGPSIIDIKTSPRRFEEISEIIKKK